MTVFLRFEVPAAPGSWAPDPAGPDFPAVEWCSPLPDVTPVDPASAAAVARFAFYMRRGVWANRESWSARAVDLRESEAVFETVYYDRDFNGVPDPVPSWCGIPGVWRAFGVPFPADGVIPQGDSDSAYVARLWTDDGTTLRSVHEVWGLRLLELDGELVWFGAHGGRKIKVGPEWGVHRDNSGHYFTDGYGVNGQPNSYTYQSGDMGVPAIGHPMPLGWIEPRDLERGWCEHPILFAMPEGDGADHRWPAQRHDGASHEDLPQGAILRLDPAVEVPADATPELACLIRTAQIHGLLFGDTNWGWQPSVRVVNSGRPNGNVVGSEHVDWTRSTLLPADYRRPAKIAT